MTYAAEAAIALRAARAAAALQRQRPQRRTHKGAVDLVTDVDLRCEQAIREILAVATPDIPVLGEEGGGADGAATRWVVDPLDGTTNFIHGLPHHAASVALEVDGEPVAGAIVDAWRGEAFVASKGGGATLDGAPIQVSEVDTLAEALVGTGFPYDRQTRAAEYLRFVERVLERCQGVRRAGAASLDLAWVAAGRLDAFWEFDLGRWDVAAGRLLVTEAGGRVRALRGRDLGDRPSPIATNLRIHERFCALLDEVP